MKHMIKLLSLALCAACLLSVTALAAETPEPIASEPTSAAVPQPLSPVGIWGKAARQENGSLLLTSGDPDASNPEVIVHLTEDTWYVDGVTGAAMDAEKIKDGDTLYIWVGPAMTMSLPPQATALLVVGNVPADGKAPQYAEITAPAIFPAPGGTERRFPIAGGELTVLESAEVKPFQTKNIVKLDDLVPGTRILTWAGEDGKINRVLVFPYAYSGYLTASEDGAILFNGEELPVKSRVLPLRMAGRCTCPCGLWRRPQAIRWAGCPARAPWCPGMTRSCFPSRPAATQPKPPTVSTACWAAAPSTRA